MNKNYTYLGFVAAGLLSASTARAAVIVYDLTDQTVYDNVFQPLVDANVKPAILTLTGTATSDLETLLFSIDLEPFELRFDDVANTYDVDYFQYDRLTVTPTTETITFTSGDKLEISDGLANTDPVGSFTAAFTNIRTTPSQLGITLDFPLFEPTLSGPASFKVSVSGSMTDGGDPANGVSLTPPTGNGAVQYTLFDLDDNEIYTFPLLTETISGSVGGSTTIPAQNPLPITLDGCEVGGCGYVRTTISFLGSGRNDRYSFTGRWDVLAADIPVAVPEPSPAAASICFGLAGLAFLFRRKR